MASSPRDTIADTCPTPDGDLTPHHVQPQHRELTSPSTDLDRNSPASYTDTIPDKFPTPDVDPTPHHVQSQHRELTFPSTDLDRNSHASYTDTIPDKCPTPDGEPTPHHVQPQHRELTSPSTDLDINSPASYTNPNPSITPTPCRKTMSANAASTADITPVRPQGCFKYDMGWQKRGSGRAYDSKSGVGTIIGNSTGKICAYGVRVSDCRMCSVYENKGQQPPTHDCHKNWAGSAKAMEPDVASELVKNIEETGIDVSVLIMDDDATTISRIRKESSHHITKWSDINHTSKQLTNSLYSLQKKHKELTNPVII